MVGWCGPERFAVEEDGVSDTTTGGVRIEVDPRYHPEESEPGTGYFFFSYRVKISNVGEVPLQLLSRHWVITDSNGRVHHVRGPGVVGQQPFLEPGDSFEYCSACPLATSMGTMYGSYQMLGPDGKQFDADISPFTLADPLSVN